MAVEGLALRACTLRFPFSVLWSGASRPLCLRGKQSCPEAIGTAKTRRGARTASGSIGRSAASPLTATAALRFAPGRFPGPPPVAPQGRSVAVEGLALRACTLRFLFSVLPGGASRPLYLRGKQSCRKDARGGANRFGLHRSLCGFAADRDRRPPFRALPFSRELHSSCACRALCSRGRFGALRLHALFSVLWAPMVKSRSNCNKRRVNTRGVRD